MTRRVMPREALEATRGEGHWWLDDAPLTSFVWWDVNFAMSDAEFASAFVDADLFDAVLTAARELDRWCEAHGSFPVPLSLLTVLDSSRAALRAYDEGQAQ